MNHFKKYSKIYLLALCFCAIVLVIAGAAYYYATTQGANLHSLQKVVPATPTPSFQPSPVVSLPTDGEDENIVTQGDNTVSFTREGNSVYLLYRNNVYSAEDQIGMQPLENFDVSKYTWYGLVKAPDFVPPSEFMHDEVFGLMPSPDGVSFAFIMRWGKGSQYEIDHPNQASIEYYLYYYSPTQDSKLQLIKKFVYAQRYDDEFYIPKLSQFNSTGEYFTLHLRSCWNCGGLAQGTLIVDWKNRIFSYIGEVSAFNFTENRSYTYKELKKVPCEDVTMGDCDEKPENLPELKGTF